MKRVTFLILLVGLTFLVFPSFGWSENRPKGNQPVITASYAIEAGYYGYSWKIFIEANDPDGDMSRIAVEVEQLGYGRYPTDWIMVKSPYRKNLKGYLQWNTFSSRAGHLREWTYITLKVTVIDKAGNESNVAIFPFEFISGAPRETKPPAPFNEGGSPRLGYIHIDLLDPTQMAGGHERES
jgi:hypothetical protein